MITKEQIAAQWEYVKRTMPSKEEMDAYLSRVPVHPQPRKPGEMSAMQGSASRKAPGLDSLFDRLWAGRSSST